MGHKKKMCQELAPATHHLGQHLETLISMANLGVTVRNKGEWEKAEELEIPVTEVREMILRVLSMVSLAATYRDQGRLKEVRELQWDLN